MPLSDEAIEEKFQKIASATGIDLQTDEEKADAEEAAADAAEQLADEQEAAAKEAAAEQKKADTEAAKAEKASAKGVVVYVAVAEAVALIAVAVTFANVVRSMMRSQERERAVLLDRIMHLTGRTWQPPPADNEPESEQVTREHRYTARPGAFVESE